jgi:hypothetical protein
MLVADSLFKPEETFLLVLRNTVGETSFDLEFSEGVASVVSQFGSGFLLDDGLKLGLSHNFKFGEGRDCAHRLSF